MSILTDKELCEILNINDTALRELIAAGKLPFEKTDGNNIFFCADTLIRWIKNPAMNDPEFLKKLKETLWEANPSAMRSIQEFSARFYDPQEPKLFYLSKVKNKKLGFVYYVRYLNDGKMVPSNWCTRTNDREAAEQWAVENRAKILEKYFGRDNIKKSYGELYAILRKYYAKDSPYLEIDKKRGRNFAEKSRVTYHNFVINQFIPYLKKSKIKDFEEIDTPLLSRLQNHLLTNRKGKDGKVLLGVKPKTVNHYINHISLIFDHLIQEGRVKINPCKSLVNLKGGVEKIRGCYEIPKLKGVFNKAWKDPFSFLLCLVIYTTGLRNSEIERIEVKDLITIDKTNFIDIPVSKTKNGVRIVPLHDFVYQKLAAYIKKTGKKNDDIIFSIKGNKKISSYVYDNANTELAEYTKYTPERLEKENITFYSGRHFWKTLMDSEKLEDIEEYFMGHKTTGDVAKRYNHKDKQGKKKLLERARRVFQILDKHIFKQG